MTTEMGVQIGRAGTDPAITLAGTARHTNGTMTVTGTHRSGTLEEHTAVRNQIQGLAGNIDEPVVPVIITGIPAGYWRVDRADWDESAGAYDDQILHATWSVSLTPVDSRAAGMWEARLVMLGDTNGSAPAASPWTAIPAQASGWQAHTGSGPVTATDRPSKSGAMTIFQAARLADNRTSWVCSPLDTYQGSAAILAGVSGAAAGDPATGLGGVEFHTVGTHTWTVPAGVTNVRVSAVGGRGGSLPGHQQGGRGAHVTGTLAVTPGQTLTVNVGGNGGNGRAVGKNTNAPNAKNAPGGAGGWNGGGTGGQGSSMHRDSFALSGGGGGGATDIRIGGTGLADRVVVAAGGGGATRARGASATAVNGGSGGPIGSGGQGASTTSPGAGGTFAIAVGHPGSLGAGGNGGTKIATGGVDYSGGGGAGAGLYGGGGGGALEQSSIAGSGGAGSSLVPADGTIRVAATNATPGVQIAPVSDTGVGEPIEGITYWPIIGREAPADPWGWQLSNGVIRVRPTWSESEIGWSVDVWTGEEWSDPHRFGLWKNSGGPVSATSVAATVTVLRNAPEAVSIRCGYSDASRIGTHTVDLTLRRGARHVDVAVKSSDTSQSWLLAHDPTAPGTGTAENTGGTNGHYLRAASDGPGGERWMLLKYRGAAGDINTDGWVTLGTAPVHAGIGYVRAGESHASVAQQFCARGSETVRYVTT